MRTNGKAYYTHLLSCVPTRPLTLEAKGAGAAWWRGYLALTNKSPKGSRNWWAYHAGRDSKSLKKGQSRYTQLVVFGSWKVEEVLPFSSLEAPATDYEIGGMVIKVKMNSLRYAVFAQSTRCCECGIEGAIMRLECDAQTHRDQNERDLKFKGHFNLYAVNAAGELILMTKDHILPVFHGGKDHLDNLRTMCAPCNSRRGHTLLPHQIEVSRKEILSEPTT